MIKIASIIIILFIFSSMLNSQTAQIFTVQETTPSSTHLSDFYHSRVKYDAQGNIHILSYDGERFYATNNKNGYFSTLKPIARGIIKIPDLISSTNLADRYDFDIDLSGVIHIAFATFKYGQGYGDSDRVYMFYTNSQIDTVYYLGKTALPISGFRLPYYFNVNVMRTTDNQIIINFLHYFPFDTVINWTQLVNPSSTNINPRFRKITLPWHSLLFIDRPKVIPFANKNLFVNLIYTGPDIRYPADTLNVERFLLKYDINEQTDQTIFHHKFSTTIFPTEVPFYIADYDNGYVYATKIQLSLHESGSVIWSSPLDNSIYTLDRQNKLHVLKITPGQKFEYYLFTNLPFGNLSEHSLYHLINRNAFTDTLPAPLLSSLLLHASISALNSNDAGILFNSPEYFIRQRQGNFVYKYLTPHSPFGMLYYQTQPINLMLYNNKPYLLSTSSYRVLNDSIGILSLYEIIEANADFKVDFDVTNIINTHIPRNIGLVPRYGEPYPRAKVDKNNNIHLLIFKVLAYNTIVGRDLGQWYYYKLTPDLHLEGGIPVHPDTLSPTIPFIDFDIDDNGVVHLIYVKYEGSTGIIYYTNNSSGSFAPPVNTGGTVSVSGTNWIRVKSAKNGNAYVVYLNYVSGVNFVYGNLSRFSTPKRLFISENLDVAGGRSKIAFEVDRDGNMHLFDISYWANYSRDLLSYKYRLVRDSVIMIPSQTGLYPNLDAPQFVSITRDKDGNVHVVGITTTQKIYHINSTDNFRSIRTYNLSDFGILSFLRSNEMPFWDKFVAFAMKDLRKIYFIAGDALDYDVLGFIPDAITSVEKDKEVIPDKFALHQNYPNPFNPSTKIEFEIPQKEHVKLVIYDILGREVMKVVDSELNAGKYSVNVNLGGFPSGVYLYKLEAGEFISTRKMVLLK